MKASVTDEVNKIKFIEEDYLCARAKKKSAHVRKKTMYWKYDDAKC